MLMGLKMNEIKKMNDKSIIKKVKFNNERKI